MIAASVLLDRRLTFGAVLKRSTNHKLSIWEERRLRRTYLGVDSDPIESLGIIDALFEPLCKKSAIDGIVPVLSAAEAKG